MRKVYLLAVVAVAVGILFALPVAATARPDHIVPVTMAHGPSGWTNHDATFKFTVQAGRHHGHLPYATTYFSVDGGAWQTGTSVTIDASPSHSNDGLHTVAYYSVRDGSVEATRSLQIGIDTRHPTTTAPSILPTYTYDYRIVVGHTAVLPYSVVDLAPNGGTADVTIKIKDSAGIVVKTLCYPDVAVNVVLPAVFTWNLPAGDYKYFVYAVDTAGNAQSHVGSRAITAYAN
jgi:hypothetical protein